MRKEYIDLRSDTVTLPKPQMLEAIVNASLGDDIMGEDATVNELERKAADLLGMEDALLVVSGTMANQIAVMGFTKRGQEIIVGNESHIFNMEGAAIAALAQVQARPINVPAGYFDPLLVESAISSGDIQRAKTALITMENTYNLNRGQIISLKNMQEIKDVAEFHDIPVYLDGARLFNASVALGVKPATLCKSVDAVQFCLTKGLGCPLGSILAGTKEFIREAKINRQRLGGGMRQAGIMAAPGIYALDHMIDRLQEDNKKAQRLARMLSTVDGLSIDIESVHTNIVAVAIPEDEMSTNVLIAKLNNKKIKVKKIGVKEIRMVVHYQTSDEDLEYVTKSFYEILEG